MICSGNIYIKNIPNKIEALNRVRINLLRHHTHTYVGYHCAMVEFSVVQNSVLSEDLPWNIKKIFLTPLYLLLALAEENLHSCICN
jgi:hypothetical protein